MSIHSASIEAPVLARFFCGMKRANTDSAVSVDFLVAKIDDLLWSIGEDMNPGEFVELVQHCLLHTPQP